jgi:hypothetical protein
MIVATHMLNKEDMENERKETEIEENISCTNNLAMLMIVAIHMLRN